ncbi:hypothetical protein G3N95_23350 [Paraburkholderia sp. Tr-20389]|uniref:hypothetical protein n=1 Tax=Paraburkholderia sp. Tr-20389 TaxID=2703903 RepID=UPI001980DB7F|nr:hypothetical protein [Paraburkholderia sp. Tr-20389]MBN3755901.1 hypothetical protein [Paraburkholderia sp. Tr-20389]
MDRQSVYPGQIPLETDLLNTNRNVLIAVGKMLSDMLGTSTYASGLGCVATAPASLSVQVQPGQLYALQNLDNTAYSSLALDQTHQIVKQGIALDATTLACAAPTTAGYSINYLIEANYADVDTNAVVLAYYNATNPAQAFSGPGGNGQPSMTTRAGKVVLTLKAGVAAATGTQITPAVDSGCVGLWVVTVANGQSTITSANISQYPGAPILPTSLLQSMISNNLEYGIDSGAANTVQATFPLPPTSLVDNQQFWVKIKTTNTGATTFTPNPGVIAAAPVVGGAHAALQGNELVANGRALFVYRTDIASYVLESCTGASLQTSPATQSQHAAQIGQSFPSVSSSVASNALTVGLTGPTALAFRNPTLTNGAPVVGSVSVSQSLTVPSGATLGSANGVQATFAILELYNGGLPQLGIVNLSGGVDLSETGLISATAISSGATSASTVYSSSAVSNSPYRVVGVIQLTEATAGTYATAPTLVQGMGGQAFAALQSFGVGQTEQSMVGSRAIGTTYYNTTGRTIWVSILMSSASVANARLQVGVGSAIFYGDGAQVAGGAFGIQFPVRPGQSYGVGYQAGSGTLASWWEIR